MMSIGCIVIKQRSISGTVLFENNTANTPVYGVSAGVGSEGG